MTESAAWRRVLLTMTALACLTALGCCYLIVSRFSEPHEVRGERVTMALYNQEQYRLMERQRRKELEAEK